MTDAREVIAGYLSTGCSLENNAWNEVFLPEADSILQALEQAGFRVVSNYEWDLRAVEAQTKAEEACIAAANRLLERAGFVVMRTVVTGETVTYYNDDGSIAYQSTRPTNPPSPSHREKAPR